MNFLIADGLAHYDLSVDTKEGLEQLAAIVKRHTRDLLHYGGPMEYFDPGTGKGLGGDTFSWSAAMWLCWAGIQ